MISNYVDKDNEKPCAGHRISSQVAQFIRKVWIIIIHLCYLQLLYLLLSLRVIEIQHPCFAF